MSLEMPAGRPRLPTPDLVQRAAEPRRDGYRVDTSERLNVSPNDAAGARARSRRAAAGLL